MTSGSFHMEMVTTKGMDQRNFYKLFDPVFGEAQMVQWNGKSKETKALRKKKSLHIKRLIVSHLRCIILKWLLVFISFDISVIFIVYLHVN